MLEGHLPRVIYHQVLACEEKKCSFALRRYLVLDSWQGGSENLGSGSEHNASSVDRAQVADMFCEKNCCHPHPLFAPEEETP